MPQLLQPSTADIRAFLDRQSTLDLTYPAVGATATTLPNGYTVDRTRVKLGAGQTAFDVARAALEHWRHFDLGWVQAFPRNAAIEPGAVVAVVARTFGVWWLNACRIVYVIDDDTTPLRRSGFAYGTLPGHAESGEERFMIEWDRTDDSVWYDILAFSRPRHPLAKLGYPLTRRLQKKFARDSAGRIRSGTGRA